MFTDLTWIDALVDSIGSVMNLAMEPPIKYFIILGLVGIVIGMLRSFIGGKKS